MIGFLYTSVICKSYTYTVLKVIVIVPETSLLVVAYWVMGWIRSWVEIFLLWRVGLRNCVGQSGGELVNSALNPSGVAKSSTSFGVKAGMSPLPGGR